MVSSRMKKLLGLTMAGAVLVTTVAGNIVPVCAKAEKDTPAITADADAILGNMSLRQKITQKLMMDFRQWNDDEGKPQDMTVLNDEVAGFLADYQFGSVILFANNIKKTGETVKLTKAMQEAATEKGGLPLLIATDQEGGKVYRLGSGTALPGNMALGATNDPKMAQKAGEIIGRELGAVGINTTLSPVIDVNNNANNPVIGLRSFSDDADMVGTFGEKYIAGLNKYNIIGCAKHFPGHGDTETDSHTGLPEVTKSKSKLLKNELKPYTIAIKKGIDMIMTAHILYPKLDNTTILSEKTGNNERRPATLSKKILTDLLRDEMKFRGVIVTDAMNMQGIANCFSMEQATVEAFKAGADLVCMPITGVTDKKEWKKQVDDLIDAVEAAVKKGELKESAVDKSVKRILTLKKDKGILSYNPSDYTEEKALKTVGSKTNRELERKIAAKAVTVIRNKQKVLPLKVKKKGKVLMLTPYDNECAQMVIGFNRAKAAGIVPKTAKVKVYRYSDTDFIVSGELQKQLDWADIVIINSEVTNKDAMALEKWSSIGPKNFTKYCKTKGKTSVILSVDKPYDVQLYPSANAVLAVYGCKGSGIDVTEQLLGGDLPESEAAYGPNIIAGVEVAFGVFGARGKLPVNIPKFDDATKTYTKTIKYKRGYGITYKACK